MQSGPPALPSGPQPQAPAGRPYPRLQGSRLPIRQASAPLPEPTVHPPRLPCYSSTPKLAGAPLGSSSGSSTHRPGYGLQGWSLSLPAAACSLAALAPEARQQQGTAARGPVAVCRARESPDSRPQCAPWALAAVPCHKPPALWCSPLLRVVPLPSTTGPLSVICPQPSPPLRQHSQQQAGGT